MNSRRDEYLEVRVKAYQSMKAAFAAHLTLELVQAVYLAAFEAEPGEWSGRRIDDAVKEAKDE